MAKRVLRTFVHQQVATLTLHLAGGGQVTTTQAHLFCVEGKGFVPAGHLAIGNAIVTRAGPGAKVVGIERAAVRTGYNLEVADSHTFFVGSTGGGLWVHNTTIACNSQEEAWAGARKEAGWPDGGETVEIGRDPLQPGSQSPQGPRGEHTRYGHISEGPDGELVENPNVIHEDPYGHDFRDGDVVGPHYGVNLGGGSQTSGHYTWPSPHDPRTNR